MNRRLGTRAAGLGFALLAAAALASLAWAERKAVAPVQRIELTNGVIVVSVLPSLGARVVQLATVGGESLLDSDPKYWAPPFPPADLATPFQPWNGRIVWAGPQSGFWSQQDLRPDLKQSRLPWPPDPFNETGRFEVVERTPTRLRLRGAPSPVTGLAFEHEFEITGERTVRMKATATNRRGSPVSWDLWPNTRVRPEGFPYVSIAPADPPRIEGPKPEEAAAGRYPSEAREGWLTIAPGHEPRPPQQRLWTKAYVQPPRGLVAYFLGSRLLLIRAPVVPKDQLHPEQAFVEIYRGAGRGATILELEMHGAYETLAPGASMSFEQTFEILDYDGAAEPAGHLARLARLPR